MHKNCYFAGQYFCILNALCMLGASDIMRTRVPFLDVHCNLCFDMTCHSHSLPFIWVDYTG